MVSSLAKGYVKPPLKLMRSMNLHVEQVCSVHSTQECFHYLRNQRTVIISLKAGSIAYLSLVLYYFPTNQGELTGREK